MTEITDEMLDIIEKIKGKRKAALWDIRCEQYLANIVDICYPKVQDYVCLLLLQ